MNNTIKFTYEEESNKYKNIYEYTSTKIIALTTYTLAETVGNALWWGIIHYELFGGDPKKRSITNKEISLLLNVILIIWLGFRYIQGNGERGLICEYLKILRPLKKNQTLVFNTLCFNCI